MITTYPITVKSMSDGEPFEMTITVSGDTVFVSTSEYIPGPTEDVESLTFTFESHLDTSGYLIYDDTTKTYWIVTFDPNEIPTIAMVGEGSTSGSGSGSGDKAKIFVCECGGIPPQGVGEVTGCVKVGTRTTGYKCLDQTCGEGCEGCYKNENMINARADKKPVAIVRGEILVYNGTVYSN